MKIRVDLQDILKSSNNVIMRLHNKAIQNIWMVKEHFTLIHSLRHEYCRRLGENSTIPQIDKPKTPDGENIIVIKRDDL